MPRLWGASGALRDGPAVQDGGSSIVVLKGLAVLQCNQCDDTELEHPTMRRVEQVLAGVDQSSELEVIRFAA